MAALHGSLAQLQAKADVGRAMGAQAVRKVNKFEELASQTIARGKHHNDLGLPPKPQHTCKDRYITYTPKIEFRVLYETYLSFRCT